MRSGFTLVEVLVSVAILLILIIGMYSVFYTGNITYNEDMGHIELQQQARQGMEWMVRELREASEVNIVVISANDDQIIFNIEDDESGITYYRDTNDSNNDGISSQIIREYPAGTRRILANDISSLKFSRSNSLLTVQLVADKIVQQRELSFSLNGNVSLRNPDE